MDEFTAGIRWNPYLMSRILYASRAREGKVQKTSGRPLAPWRLREVEGPEDGIAAPAIREAADISLAPLAR